VTSEELAAIRARVEIADRDDSYLRSYTGASNADLYRHPQVRADMRALLNEVARLTAEVERLRGELAEAQATLANERGEGEPPVPGFLFTGNAGERSAWCSVDGPVGAYVTREIGNMGRVRWQWAVIEDRYGSDESPRFRDLARGYEPTARAAMRAAAKAVRGES
jgi:hypothetical protein